LLTTVITCVTRTLVRSGVLVAEDEHPYLDLPVNSPYEHTQLSTQAGVATLIRV
jgi:hypothetical protein